MTDSAALASIAGVDGSDYRGVAFLLSLGVVPIACFHDGGEVETSAGVSATMTTSSATTGESEGSEGTAGTETAGTEGTSKGTSEGTSTTEGATATEGTTEGSSSTGDGTSSGTSGVAAGCAAYAEHLVDCGLVDPEDEAVPLSYCLDVFASAVLAGEDCVAASESAVACLAEADCRALDSGDACPAELAAYFDACSVCAAYAAKAELCDAPNPEELAAECTDLLNFSKSAGVFCEKAATDYYECLSDLDCEEFDDPLSCAIERDIVESACD